MCILDYEPKTLVLVRLVEEHDAWRHRGLAETPCEGGLDARDLPTRDEPRTSIARHVYSWRCLPRCTCRSTPGAALPFPYLPFPPPYSRAAATHLARCRRGACYPRATCRLRTTCCRASSSGAFGSWIARQEDLQPRTNSTPRG